MATTTLTGIQAIEAGELLGVKICKYTDPTEEAREGLDAREAREIARQDPSLIYVDLGEATRALVTECRNVDDGTGTLAIIARQALLDGEGTPERVREIVHEAREEWAAERAHQAGLK